MWISHWVQCHHALKGQVMLTTIKDNKYRKVITNFVAWCELNHLAIDASKTKEVVIDFRRKAPQTAPVNIQGLDIEIVEEYKYLGVHINNKLDWTHNTDVLYKKGQSCLHLLWRPRSFGECRSLLKTFNDSKRARSILDCPLGLHWGGGWEEDVSQADINHGQPLSPPTWDCGGFKQLLQQQTASPKV